MAGLGCVYLARDSVLGQSVALEILPPDLVSDLEDLLTRAYHWTEGTPD